MAYAGTSDLQSRYPDTRLAEVTDPVGGTVDSSKIDIACEDASSEIDSYLSQRYPLPLTTVPDILVRVCCDIAIYRLFALLPKESVDDARRRYEDAIKWLKGVVTGKEDLGIPYVIPGSPTLGEDQIQFASIDRVFTSVSLTGYTKPSYYS